MSTCLRGGVWPLRRRGRFTTGTPTPGKAGGRNRRSEEGREGGREGGGERERWESNNTGFSIDHSSFIFVTFSDVYLGSR